MARIEGAEEIVAKLKKLRETGADRAAMAGARAATKEIEKGIKAAIPGQYRSARKGIGRRVKRKKGEVIAKVGAGVGGRSKSKRERKKRSGVGLSKNNIHWAILGVGERRTKKGFERGKHGGFLAGVVKEGASNAEIRAALAMQDAVKKEIEKATK